MAEMETQLPMTVQLSTVPSKATDDARIAAVYLKKLLDNKKKKVVINGKRHIEFEDWITLGNYYGIDVRTGDAEPVEVHGIKGAKAKAEVIRIDDGTVIGGAEAYCLADEKNWKNKPFFQLASMAQTRAGSKALSNVLRWVVALEGISGTPAEEMEDISDNSRPTRKPPSSRPPRPGYEDVPPGVDHDNVQDAETTTKPRQRRQRPAKELTDEELEFLKKKNHNLKKAITILDEDNVEKSKVAILKILENMLGDESLPDFDLEAFKKCKEDLHAK
jgi:hypothetical protein